MFLCQQKSPDFFQVRAFLLAMYLPLKKAQTSLLVSGHTDKQADPTERNATSHHATHSDRGIQI